MPPVVSNPQSQQAMTTELCLRLRGHRDRQCYLFHRKVFITSNDFYMHLDYVLESRKAEAKQL